MAMVEFLASAVGSLWRERRCGAEEIQRVQERRLRALVRHAHAHTTLGRQRLGHLDLAGPLDLTRIPSITKEELIHRFEDSIADGALSLDEVERVTQQRENIGAVYRGQYVIATTSGTTGRVGYFVTDKGAWAALNGALFARILRHRLIPREIIRFCYGRRYRMAMTIATEGHFITRLVSTFRPLLTRGMVNIKAFSVMNPLRETIENLNRFRPHYLHSYPTYLEALAHAKARGDLDIEPEFISLGSEPVSRLAIEAIRSAFPTAEISETYGATECLTMANQCKAQNLHINNDLCILEPVDRHGHPVPPGVPSEKVLVTNLLNRAQPLLRYELPDSITVLEGQCPCGTAFPMVRVEGRSDDTFFLADARGDFHAYPPVPFEVLFLNVSGLEQYQLVHEAQNHLRIHFVPERGADAPAVASRLNDRFHDYFAKNAMQGCVRIDVVPVDRIDREARGHKLRQVYSKVPRPALAV